MIKPETRQVVVIVVVIVARFSSHIILNNNINDGIQDFKDLKQIPEWLLKSCDKLGFSFPTEVQKISLPVLLL